jgi:hypothetical protein
MSSFLKNWGWARQIGGRQNADFGQEAFYSKPYYILSILSGLLGHEEYQIQQKLAERLILLDSHQENFWVSFFFANPARGASGPWASQLQFRQ